MAELDRLGRSAEVAELLGDWATVPGPLYRSLAAALRAAIASGALARGDRLPAERRLADVLGLSRSTVVAAYDDLRDDGWVISRPGSGTVVTASGSRATALPDGRLHGGGATALLQRMADEPAEVISLSHVDDGAAELVGELADLVRTDLPLLLADAGYHPRGLEALRVAIAAHYTGLDLPTDREQILVTNGATQAIGLIAQLYLRRNAPVVVESPSWPGCLDMMRPTGASLVGVPLDDEGIRPDLLHAAITTHDPALAFVMPTYHNPTGTLMSAGRRRQVAELADRFRFPLLEDIAYPAVSGDASPPIAAFASGTAEILTVSGLSKSVWAGLRIGWVRGSVNVIDRLARLRARADMGGPVLDQALAARLLPRIGELAQPRERQRLERLEAACDLLRERLPDWRWRIPDGGPALWIELPGADTRAFAVMALRHGVEVVPGHATDPHGGHDSFIRLPYTFSPPTLNVVVQRLAGAWEEFSRDRVPTIPDRPEAQPH